MRHLIIFFFLCLCSCCRMVWAQQVEIMNGYVTGAGFEDADGHKAGRGNFVRFVGKCDFPIARTQDGQGAPLVWQGSVKCAYGQLNNSPEAAGVNPYQILNAGFTLSHLRPLNDKWNLILSAGVGVYTTVDEFSLRDLLVNAAVIFYRRQNERLQWGIGAGLSNTYGIPMLMPMPYVHWRYSRRFEIELNMLGRGTLSASLLVHRQVKLNLDALDIEGYSSVRKVEGEAKVYALTLLKTGFRPEYNFKQSVFFGSVGVVWSRSVSMVDHSIKGFFQTFDKDRKMSFGPSFDLTVGYRYRF